MPASAWNRSNNSMAQKMADARPARPSAAPTKAAGRSALPTQPKAALKSAKRRKKASPFKGEKASTAYQSAGQNRAIQTRIAARQQMEAIPARNDRRNIVWGD